MRGDGIRRYPNGAHVQPPKRALLTIEEVRDLEQALWRLKPLAEALGRNDNRHDAAAAVGAIERLIDRDRVERGGGTPD